MARLEWVPFTVMDMRGWAARDKRRTYTISHEPRSGPGFEEFTGYTASWRPVTATSGYNKIGSGPFATLDEAKAAVRTKIVELENARRLAAKSRRYH